ncbi:hypothetical protein PoB_005723800 [Plakobranchus ocellatus]|uniref:Uncharacterized protein n=1 Tax=Plakobranchus ocellatus TaxID=259542 RepID=A0AAV4CI33_9GAST|nr:hypothetical protein PoB_005723800 [Plakobranchus ocellatus]
MVVVVVAAVAVAAVVLVVVVEIDDWLAKINSRVTLMERSASHFCYVVNSTARRFDEMEESELGEFLALPVDLDTISLELFTLGVTKSTFSKPSPADFAKKFKSNDTPYTAAATQASTVTFSSSAAPVQPLSLAPSLAPIQPLPSAPQAQPTALKQPLPSVQQPQKTVDHPSRPSLAVIVSRKINKCTQCSESQEQILGLKDIIHVLKKRSKDLS